MHYYIQSFLSASVVPILQMRKLNPGVVNLLSQSYQPVAALLCVTLLGESAALSKAPGQGCGSVLTFLFVLLPQ